MAGRRSPATCEVTVGASAAEEQPTLFELAVSEPEQVPCLPGETDPPWPSGSRDAQPVDRLHRLCGQLQQAVTQLERARVAAEIRNEAEGIVAAAVRKANRGGLTWREIGAELGVPFQTLYRRYGGEERT